MCMSFMLYFSIKQKQVTAKSLFFRVLPTETAFLGNVELSLLCYGTLSRTQDG